MPEDAGVTQMPGNVFFDQQRKLVTPRLGEVIRQAGHLRSGVDGRLWRYDGGVYRPDGDVFTRDQIRTLLGDECRRVHFDEVMTWLRSFPPTITGAVSTKYLNVTNGMLDWRTGELSEHDPEHCSTIQLPVAWNPEARCPRFAQFLGESMPEDAAPFAEEILGYGLLPSNPFHKAVLLKGPAGNGKSKFIGVAERLYGSENVSNMELINIAENRFATADLLGKLANLCGDIDTRAIRQSSTFKEITGGDTIAAERKFGQPFSFRPFALLIFSANEAPFSADQSEAWFDRWLILPMPTRFRGTDREDPYLDSKLAREIEGIFVLAVAGLRRLMDRGRFAPPQSVTDAGAEYREQLDTAAGFIAEGCVLHVNAWVSRPALYKAYRSWCEDSGRFPTSAVHFYARLRQRFEGQIEDRKRQGWPGFAGIGLLAEDRDNGEKGEKGETPGEVGAREKVALSSDNGEKGERGETKSHSAPIRAHTWGESGEHFPSFPFGDETPAQVADTEGNLFPPDFPSADESGRGAQSSNGSAPPLDDDAPTGESEPAPVENPETVAAKARAMERHALLRASSTVTPTTNPAPEPELPPVRPPIRPVSRKTNRARSKGRRR